MVLPNLNANVSLMLHWVMSLVVMVVLVHVVLDYAYSLIAIQTISSRYIKFPFVTNPILSI